MKLLWMQRSLYFFGSLDLEPQNQEGAASLCSVLRTAAYFNKLPKYFCTLLECLTRLCDSRQTDYWVILWNVFAPAWVIIIYWLNVAFLFCLALASLVTRLWRHPHGTVVTVQWWRLHNLSLLLIRSQSWHILANRLLSPHPSCHWIPVTCQWCMLGHNICVTQIHLFWNGQMCLPSMQK